MDTDKAKQLYDKYINGTCTPEEKLWFENLYNIATEKAEPWRQEIDFQSLEQQIYKGLPRAPKKSILMRLLPYAAALFLILGVGTFFFVRHQRESELIPLANHISTGGNKAYLTLADGKRIALTGAANGALAEQSGVEVSKTADGRIVYRTKISGTKGIISGFNAVETPKGGQYQVTLPDGTNVWLNAASSLRYPASFARLKERRVELSGEAYFEVTKDRSHAFVVKTAKQEVQVLGTHFNVNAYVDEPLVRTTLLEGSVRVSVLSSGSEQVIRPGEQAVLGVSGLRVEEVDAEKYVDWKQGYFRFQDEPIYSVMRKISRWYDVQVRYEGEIPLRGLGGTISRYKNVSKVLEMLQATGLVKFRIEGRTIIVTGQ